MLKNARIWAFILIERLNLIFYGSICKITQNQVKWLCNSKIFFAHYRQQGNNIDYN